MSLMDDLEPPRSSRRTVIAGLLLAAIVIGSLLGVWTLSRTAQVGTKAPGTSPLPQQAAREEPPLTPQAPPGGSEATTAPSSSWVRRARPKPAAAAEPAPPAPVVGTLTIESDVAGAMVFLNREFKGNAPVTIEAVAPGSHRLNVSAEGYEGYSDAVDVVAGPNRVAVRFKEVKLNEAILVVHKHTIGSCKGRLVADLEGLRYETPNKNDAFLLKFSELDVFEGDYLKKTLRVKQKGGRSYTFTGDNADALFVFHKNVQNARERLAKGDPPAASKPK